MNLPVLHEHLRSGICGGTILVSSGLLKRWKILCRTCQGLGRKLTSNFCLITITSHEAYDMCKHQTIR